MGQKDISEKLLEDYNDVFADIINVLLFNGEQIVKEDSLDYAQSKTFFKAESGKLHELERDVSKYWKDGSVKIAIYGLENQTKPEKYMPMRIIGYDGTAYREQLLKENMEDSKFPVVTLVLYFGIEHWTQPKTLKEVLDIPDIINQYVNDYKIHVFEIAWLTDEQVNMFKSDFKIIANYFVKKRKKQDFVEDEKIIKHVDAFLKMMKVLTGDDRYEVSFSDEEKERGVRMCEVMDRAIDEKLAKIVKEMLEDNMPIEKIAKYCGESIGKINEIIKMLPISK